MVRRISANEFVENNEIYYRQTAVEPALGDDDWFAIRDCFVRAFHHYPLYKYMIPDEKNRPEFLKNYLEAVYDVTVRNGNSIVLSIKIKSESNEVSLQSYE